MSGRSGAAKLAWGALAVAMVGAAVLSFHLTRSTSLWFDDWNWALYRRGGGLHSLLAPYNGHLSLVPVAVYKLLFATEGIGSYTGYRILVIVCHLVCAGLVFAYARRRVGDYLALLAACLILFLGPAWQDILWPFQIGWLISVAAGVGALLMLDRRDAAGDGATCLLLGISVASSSVGVPVLIGAIVDVAWTRRRWRDAWVVAVPAVAYAAWSLGYQNSELMASDIFAVPRWAATSVAAAASALVGLSGQSIGNDAGTVLEFGVPLGLVATGLMILRARRRPGWPIRAVSLAAISVVFWVLTAIGRAFLGHPYASRYVYVDCVFGLLLAVELAAGLRVRPWLGAVLGVVALAAVVSNIGILRDAGSYLRDQAPNARADLAALDLSQASVPASYVPRSFPGYPFLVIHAGDYFAMRRSIGTPAYSIAALATAPEPAREVADAELIRIHGVAVQPGAGSRLAGTPPAVAARTAMTLRRVGGCDRLSPAPFTAPGVTPQAEVEVPPAGLALRSGGTAVSLGARRFAGDFQPVGTLAAGAVGTLRIAPDAAAAPWRLQLSAAAPVTVCSQGPGAGDHPGRVA